MKVTITITRQMGSLGSHLGKLIAEKLDFRYVDREILYLAAQEFGVEPAVLTQRAEKISSFWEKTLLGFTLGSPDSKYTPPPHRQITDKELFDKQTEIMKTFAVENDCVIVGWGGKYVLPHHSRMLTVFCHAPLSFRIKRIMKVHQLDNEASAEKMISESDDMKKKYIAHMTGKDWACAENYDLSVNTSLLSIERISELLVEIINEKTRV